MSKKTWTLTNVEQGTYVERIALDPEMVGGSAAGYSVAKRRLQGGLSDGVDVIEVDNGAFRFIVIPTRGMGLWKANLGDLQLGWKSPVRGPVHPSMVRMHEASGLGWLDGFDELLCRCGLESHGAPDFNDDGTLRYGLHGRIANIPAHSVETRIDGDSGEIAITGVVDEARLFGNKLRLTSTITTQVGRPGLTVTDTITNISAEPSELELLYHINFGRPFLSPGAKVVLPVKRLVPRDSDAVGNLAEWDTYGHESPGLREAVFFFDLVADADGFTRAVLHDAAGDRGVGLRFNKSQLPWFALWKNRQAAEDGYVTGLEPCTSFPNPRSFENRHGRVIVLAPGESRTCEVALEAYGDSASLRTALEEVARLQQGTPPEIVPQPDPAWAAG